VRVNTFRMWDSGLRPAPTPILVRARTVVTHHAQQTELLPLVQLAQQLRLPLLEGLTRWDAQIWLTLQAK